MSWRLGTEGRASFTANAATVWKYTPATLARDRSYLPVLGSGNFPVGPGDVLWVVTPVDQDG